MVIGKTEASLIAIRPDALMKRVVTHVQKVLYDNAGNGECTSMIVFGE